MKSNKIFSFNPTTLPSPLKDGKMAFTFAPIGLSIFDNNSHTITPLAY